VPVRFRCEAATYNDHVRVRVYVREGAESPWQYVGAVSLTANAWKAMRGLLAKVRVKVVEYEHQPPALRPKAIPLTTGRE